MAVLRVLHAMLELQAHATTPAQCPFLKGEMCTAYSERIVAHSLDGLIFFTHFTLPSAPSRSSPMKPLEAP